MSRIEQTILTNLLKDDEFARGVIPYLKSEYFQDRGERLLYEHINKFIEEYNEGRSMFDFALNQDAWRDYYEELQSFSGRWRELNESANASLEAQLGPELAATLNDPRAIRQRALAEAESESEGTAAQDPPNEQPRDTPSVEVLTWNAEPRESPSES